MEGMAVTAPPGRAAGSARGASPASPCAGTGIGASGGRSDDGHGTCRGVAAATAAQLVGRGWSGPGPVRAGGGPVRAGAHVPRTLQATVRSGRARVRVRGARPAVAGAGDGDRGGDPAAGRRERAVPPGQAGARRTDFRDAEVPHHGRGCRAGYRGDVGRSRAMRARRPWAGCCADSISTSCRRSSTCCAAR